MDLKPFKLDIDDLIQDFVDCGSVTFPEFKKVWLSKKFTYIFESRPSSNQGFFMQSLYAHSIDYMTSGASFSSRVGGLYCMYCLYETQPFKRPFKIYLSLGELRQLKNFVIETKQRNLYVVSAVVRRMLEKNMFFFGAVGDDEVSATQRVNELTDLQNGQVQVAHNKLFAGSRLEHFINLDMKTELDVELIKKRSSDYALAKERAIKEASKVIGVDDVEHIVEKEPTVGVLMERTAEKWNSQKALFYEQTGSVPQPIAAAAVPPEGGNDHDLEEENQDDAFQRELDNALLFE